MVEPLAVEGLGKAYGGIRALDGVTLEARAGEVLGLLGHNGAGKTTLMKLTLGTTAPSEGRVRLFGTAPGAARRELRRRVGYLPENVAFYDGLTGRETLAYFGRLKGADRADCTALLERVGLAGAADRPVRTYSKGMRQRLGLAQALLGPPRLLLLDEPTAGLDPAATADLYAMLDDLRAAGTAVVLSSHVLAGIERHIDRAAILRHGRLLAAGSHQELMDRARLPVVVRARGDWREGRWQDGVEAAGARLRRVDGTELEVTAASADKLAVVRALLACPGLSDLAVEPPSLESVYAHFGGSGGTP